MAIHHLERSLPIEAHDPSNDQSSWFERRADEANMACILVGVTDGTIDGLYEQVGDLDYFLRPYTSADGSRTILEPVQQTTEQRIFHKARNALAKAAIDQSEPEKMKAAAMKRLLRIEAALRERQA